MVLRCFRWNSSHRAVPEPLPGRGKTWGLFPGVSLPRVTQPPAYLHNASGDQPKDAVGTTIPSHRLRDIRRRGETLPVSRRGPSWRGSGVRCANIFSSAVALKGSVRHKHIFRRSLSSEARNSLVSQPPPCCVAGSRHRGKLAHGGRPELVKREACVHRSGPFCHRPSDPLPVRDPPLGAVSRQRNPALLPCCRARAFAAHHHGTALGFTLLNFIVSADFHREIFIAPFPS